MLRVNKEKTCKGGCNIRKVGSFKPLMFSTEFASDTSMTSF